MESIIRIDGRVFEWIDEMNAYQCRGEVMYDDEHDQIPEPALWDAAEKLVVRLKEEGHFAQAEHSEKGWVEVQILKKEEA